VLFVDDEAALVSLASRVLARLGHRVTSFTDPRTALAAFAAHPDDFDVVVTDLSMPHMSGFDLARAVTALRPALPVLMTTGYVTPDDEATAHGLGIRALVLKPFSVDHLARLVDQPPGGGAN
jgi:CheY-like chemotaxis protein